LEFHSIAQRVANNEDKRRYVYNRATPSHEQVKVRDTLNTCQATGVDGNVRFSLLYRTTSSDFDGGKYPSSLFEQKFYSTYQQINRRDFTQRDLLILAGVNNHV